MYAFELTLGLQRELIRTIDSQFSAICKKAAESSDPDGYGYLDNIEDVVGLGMVACQTYMAAVYGGMGMEKSHTLKFGPRYPDGPTKVEVINHAANYWKYNHEWGRDRSSKRKAVIEEAFKSIGFPVGTEYPLSRVIEKLTESNDVSLERLIEILEAWKDELVQKVGKRSHRPPGEHVAEVSRVERNSTGS